MWGSEMGSLISSSYLNREDASHSLDVLIRSNLLLHCYPLLFRLHDQNNRRVLHLIQSEGAPCLSNPGQDRKGRRLEQESNDSTAVECWLWKSGQKESSVGC